jgi:hypothetical protein
MSIVFSLQGTGPGAQGAAGKHKLRLCQGIGNICHLPLLSVCSTGRILGRNWDKNLKSFPPFYSQSPLLTDFTPPEQKWFETGFVM